MSIPRRAALKGVVIAPLALGLVACGSISTGSRLLSPTAEATLVPSLAPVAVEPAATITVNAGAGLVLPGDDGTLYVATGTGIYGIDPTTNEASQVVDGLTAPYGFNVGFGSAWISRSDETRGWIERYNLTTGALLASIEVGRMPLETLTAFGSVWVPNHHSGSVSRIDPETNAVVATIEIPASDPYALAADEEMVWSTSPNGGFVSGIDPESNTVEIEARASACGVTALAGRVWAAACESQLTMIFSAADGGQLGRIRAGLPISDGERYWATLTPMTGPVSNDVPSLVLIAIDPETLSLGRAVETELASPGALVVAFGSLWVTSGDAVFRYALDVLPA
jgi:YVTN family beta-propeller protein